MARVTVEDCLEHVHNRFSLVLLGFPLVFLGVLEACIGFPCVFLYRGH